VSGDGLLARHARYVSQAAPQDELRLGSKALTRVRYAYRRLHVVLRREGWAVNATRIYRLYKEDRLVIRLKTPKGTPSTAPLPR
jgi:putative transposase